MIVSCIFQTAWPFTHTHVHTCTHSCTHAECTQLCTHSRLLDYKACTHVCAPYDLQAAWAVPAPATSAASPSGCQSHAAWAGRQQGTRTRQHKCPLQPRPLRAHTPQRAPWASREELPLFPDRLGLFSVCASPACRQH